MTKFDSNRRTIKRHHSLVTAFLLISGRPPVACVLRDLSPHGAKVDLGETDPGILPQKLLLFLPGVDKLFTAEVRWQGTGAIGLKFVLTETERTQSMTSPDIFALQLQVADLALSQKPAPERCVA